MGITGFSVKLSSFLVDNDFRIDSKFHTLMNKTGFNIFDINDKYLIPLKDCLIPFYEVFQFQDEDEYFGIPTGKEYTNEFGEIVSTQIVTKNDCPDRLKYRIDEDCILISSLKGAKIPALNFNFNFNLSKYIFSNGFYIFKVTPNWNKRFMLYLLRNNTLKFILDNNLYRGIGISSYKEDDFLKILVPKIDKSIQDEVVLKIEIIEKEITQLKDSKTPTLDIINRVFGEEFGFDWQEFERLKAQKVFTLKLSDFSNNLDCRMGIRFHNLAGEYLYSFLSKISDKKIKDFIAEPIVLGASVSPSDYDENGEYYYIAMSNIKTWVFDDENCKKVSDVYSQNNQNKTLQKNDILLARSGEGTIGKVALIEVDDVNAIFADFTQRIRLTEFDPLCAYYYFRSDFFQYLIYTHKKGLGNNTNIYPSQIQEFPMPDWDEQKQAQIVKKIRIELEKQEKIDIQIEKKHETIYKLIENSIYYLN